MEKSERGKLHFRIVCRIGGALFIRMDPIQSLPLGEEYAERMASLCKKRDDILNRMLNDLAKFGDEQITKRFSDVGKPILEESKSWAIIFRREIDLNFKHLPVWYGIVIFRTKTLADFEYWSRSDFLSVDEVVWLSVGFEPKEQLKSLIKPYNEHGGRQKLDGVAEYVSRHKEMIRRKFDPYDFNKKPDLTELFDWINAMNLNVHPAFMAMLKKRVGLVHPTAKDQARFESPKQIDGREKQSMSKLIAAMAIDCYGFDPRARRSDIPNEIQGIADRLGLDISSDTIRKYLKAGAELIPEDWEPE